MTPAAQIAAQLAAERRLLAELTSASKAAPARVEELCGELSRTAPDGPSYRSLLGELALADTGMKYASDLVHRAACRVEMLRTASAGTK